ncbi:transposase family protein [Streptomyces sp. NPDC056254]|uniref:helix-turn-helix domain-containing protein n=1 Tax=Streptomyces sp. NPDC056254 TaxID=3345763 RepID=UPI0035E29408
MARDWSRGHGSGPWAPTCSTSSLADWLLATLVHLRHGATHDVLARWFGIDWSTIIRAICEVRPLPAARGCTIVTGVRLRTSQGHRPPRPAATLDLKQRNPAPYGERPAWACARSTRPTPVFRA